MSHDGVYPRSEKPARNFNVIVKSYWALCLRDGTVLNDEVMDSYLLATVLPYVRSNGARRVFDDAVLGRKGGRRSEQEEAQTLDRALVAERERRLDWQAFHHRTADLLGPYEVSEEVRTEYASLTEELLGGGREAVGHHGDGGLRVPIKIVQDWMRTFARRGGNEARKSALDILSYECRAALHRCYSACWFELLTQLERKYEMDQASVQYHRLMHFNLFVPSQRRDADFHLFHGHIFALHPGISRFLQTPTGGELIGDYLRHDGGEPFERLLNGFWIALLDYHGRSADVALERKKLGFQAMDGDVEALAALQARGRGRRRLPGVRHDDDRAAG